MLSNASYLSGPLRLGEGRAAIGQESHGETLQPFCHIDFLTRTTGRKQGDGGFFFGFFLLTQKKTCNFGK